MAGELAKNVINGMQGVGMPGSSKYALILAGAKHFSMFDGPKNGGDAVITVHICAPASRAWLQLV